MSDSGPKKRPTGSSFRAVSVKQKSNGSGITELQVGMSKGWIVSVATLAITVIGSIVGWLSFREDRFEKRVIHEVKTEMRAVKAEVKSDAQATIINAKELVHDGMVKIHKENHKLQKELMVKQELLRTDLVREMRRVRRAVAAEEGP